MKNQSYQRVRPMGLHLMLTLIDCDKDRLQDYDKVFGLLKSLPGRIGMTLIPVDPNPTLFYCQQDEKNPDNIGFSGGCLLWESHFTLHTWPVYDEVDLDIFSCYSFDTDKTIQYLIDFFKGTAVNISIVNRGNNGIIWNSGI